MVEYNGAYDERDCAAFLDEAVVPMRVSTHRPDGSPWIVTLWYRYRDGVFECATRADAAIVDFLDRDDRVGIDVSTNTIPYRGVRGTGTVTIDPDEELEVLGALVDRYLGDRDHPLAQTLLDEDREEVCLRIDPDELFSWDYSERMEAA
ncbi:pyridoxamine 5'-phosphate oxidase family protein [Halococcoides cellulosivorans]|uniref:Pyridoxamine 5'-phosphate oxidase n=1 Tax=Halococcoides cellulosivorans TaxID=1679096 RepID=A0A2R4WZK8_9EURY|nr:pyridoxamine 5'-phosphate oxidase family protein [Halococcoides cellulosivorans]AWB26972.1 pyridoxamine 5'-phosphate oxidase [Halococcoides cellulosivorans]